MRPRANCQDGSQWPRHIDFDLLNARLLCPQAGDDAITTAVGVGGSTVYLAKQPLRLAI
jgi:hypothetical protein